ncbi:MAG: hypothetical protein PVJ57_21790 [Phycisphaerae bacterium]|jgi:hypothetical protein
MSRGAYAAGLTRKKTVSVQECRGDTEDESEKPGNWRADGGRNALTYQPRMTELEGKLAPQIINDEEDKMILVTLRQGGIRLSKFGKDRGRGVIVLIGCKDPCACPRSLRQMHKDALFGFWMLLIFESTRLVIAERHPQDLPDGLYCTDRSSMSSWLSMPDRPCWKESIFPGVSDSTRKCRTGPKNARAFEPVHVG